MLGWINISIAAFICDTFGVDKWEEVKAASGVSPNWASSCPYSDKITYDLVVTAAGLLGVSVNDALEAYGLYFVQHVEDQGYTRLLNVLGSNLAEFLQNLNDLHLHLQYCWPDMLAPAFRCEQVTPQSLLLHYFSNRQGLWPIVVGVLKGMSNDYFKLNLKVELVHSREKGDCDHEVLKLTYPYQPALRDWGQESQAAQRSVLSIPAPLFYELHPFHLVMDEQLRLLQWGAAVGRVVRDLQAGQNLRDVFRCKVPSYIQLDYPQILVNTNSSFVLQSRSSGITLKGQMLPTTVTLPGASPGAPPTPVLVFLASPWMRSLRDMQASGVFLSDIPRYDLSSDYILLAEQRQAEADLKDKYERLTLELQAANEKLARTTAFLEEEKARAEALLYRMSGLIACFPAAPNLAAAGDGNTQLKHTQLVMQQQQGTVVSLLDSTLTTQQQQQTVQQQQQQQTAQLQLLGQLPHSLPNSHTSLEKQSSALDRIEAVRRELARHNLTSSRSNTIQCLELLGEGTYGKVYKGLWKGSVVAVKTIVLPAVMTGQEKREKMAIMEAAISSALSHPNIISTYTYDIKPIKDNSRPEQQLVLLGSTASTGGPGETGSSGASEPISDNIHSYEVRLVCEYCDKGSLREALDLGAFSLPDGSVNYPAVLDTAIEIATAVAHLHNRNVLHSDLKARNIMLTSTGGSGRGVIAKVADFGLAVKMDHMETHLSNAFQGTMTHMAPEILIKGHISKAADVYALGMVLWELYTAQKVFKGIPRALLGHQITQLNRRPEFPVDAPQDYVRLTQACWDPSPANRPILEVVLERLQAMRAALRRTTEPLAPYDMDSVINRKAGAAVSTARLHVKSPGLGDGITQAAAAQQQQQQQQHRLSFTQRSPQGTQQQPARLLSSSRSTHAAARYLAQQEQQQQRVRRMARRTVSTPLIKPSSGSSQTKELRTAVSVSTRQLLSSTSSGVGAGDLNASNGKTLPATSASSQPVQVPPQHGVGSPQQLPPALSGSCPRSSGWAHYSDCLAAADDAEEEGSGSDRSVYLEHSSSTCDGEGAAWQEATDQDGQPLSFSRNDLRGGGPAGLLLQQDLNVPTQSGLAAAAAQLDKEQQQQQQLQHSSTGFGSFASAHSGSGESPLRCPFAGAAAGASTGFRNGSSAAGHPPESPAVPSPS